MAVPGSPLPARKKFFLSSLPTKVLEVSLCTRPRGQVMPQLLSRDAFRGAALWDSNRGGPWSPAATPVTAAEQMFVPGEGNFRVDPDFVF